MKIAIFGKSFDDNFDKVIYKIFEKSSEEKVEIIIFDKFLSFIEKKLLFRPKINETFCKADDLDNVDLVISIGGDGTFLECASILKNKNFPIIGINSGRLGFLASVSKEQIDQMFVDIFTNKINIEERTLIDIDIKSTKTKQINFPYALNELTVQKKDTTSMLNIDVFINDVFLNTYWADGLIVATPTGSTAYSLSAGGPIVFPQTKNFVITPLAPHTLTVRPIVIDDNSVIKIIVNGRGNNFIAALDSRNIYIDFKTEIIVKKADFKVKIAKISDDDFFKTIRQKLMWGLDIRNYS